MRLSRGEIIFFVLIIVITWYSLSPLVHSSEKMHTLVVESRGDSPHSLDPTWELYSVAKEEGMTLTGWKLYWKKTLHKQEEKELNVWLNKHEQFVLVAEEKAESPEQEQIKRQLWQSQDEASIHQIQLITYPHNSHYQSKFIYTWSGQEINEEWMLQRAQMEDQFANLFDHLPQNFTCLEGITNGKLKFDMSILNMFDHWLTQLLEGELKEQIVENNFISVTGYIPTWEERYIMHGDHKLNLQLSARYNALEQQTRVTIGYPIIISEH